MRKQVLSEEFKRMQKLANIKEARFTNPDKKQVFYADATDIDLAYDAVVEDVKEQLKIFDNEFTEDRLIDLYLNDRDGVIFKTVRQNVGELMVKDNIELNRGGQEVLVTFKNIPSLTKEELADYITENTELFNYLRSLVFLFIKDNIDISEYARKVEEQIMDDRDDYGGEYRDDGDALRDRSIIRGIRNWSADYVDPWFMLDPSWGDDATDFEGFIQSKLSKLSNIISEIRLKSGDKNIDRIAIELKGISGEEIDSQYEFTSYIRDYYNNPGEYGIEEDSDYYNALQYAYNHPADAWERYQKVW